MDHIHKKLIIDTTSIPVMILLQHPTVPRGPSDSLLFVFVLLVVGLFLWRVYR